MLYVYIYVGLTRNSAREVVHAMMQDQKTPFVIIWLLIFCNIFVSIFLLALAVSYLAQTTKVSRC
jgi:hypothetical protein